MLCDENMSEEIAVSTEFELGPYGVITTEVSQTETGRLIPMSHWQLE